MKIILSANTDWYLYNFRLTQARFLRSLGWEVLLSSPAGDFSDRLQAEGFRWLPWNLGRKTTTPWTEWAAIREMTALYQLEAPDLVHHYTIKPSIYGSIAARRAGVPGIVNSITGRGFVFLEGGARIRLLRALVHWMYRYAFRRPNLRAIFENQSDLEYFIRQRLIEPGRAVLVESVGVDPEVYTPSPPPDGTPVVMMAARMLWDKGVGEFVEAARLIGAPHRARAVLVGGPDEGNPSSVPVAQLEAYRNEGVVEWWGFQDDMNAVLARCSIFVLPTKYAEGVPVALLEAAACGRPIVTTTVPGARDAVVDGENGLLVPPGDARALAAALERLLPDPETRGRMGQAGRKRILERFTAEQVNQKTLAVYRTLVDC